MAYLQPKIEFNAEQLHERLITVPYERSQAKSLLAEAASKQNWVPFVDKSHVNRIADRKRELGRSLISLLKSKQIASIDKETQSALTECVMALDSEFYDMHSHDEAPGGVEHFFTVDSPDPMAVVKLRCLVSIANGVASPR